MDRTFFAGRGGFTWFQGVVEDRMDPLKLGRVRVRCFGYHSEDKGEIPVASLPWAVVSTSAVNSGIGTTEIPTENTWCWGFFEDGDDAQHPVVCGYYAGIPSTARETNQGFTDPRADNGAYPRRVSSITQGSPGAATSISQAAPQFYPAILNEPDVHRLARNESTAFVTQKTIRESNTTSSVNIAGGGTWAEPANPYAAVYPFNTVKETESGHLVEFDDTKNAERIMVMHRTGTFEEAQPDGSVVKRIIQNFFAIVFGAWNEYVRGEKRVTVEKGMKLLVGTSTGDLTITVEDGKVKITSSDNIEMTTDQDVVMTVGGDVNHTATGNYNITATGSVNITGASINLN